MKEGDVLEVFETREIERTSLDELAVRRVAAFQELDDCLRLVAACVRAQFASVGSSAIAARTTSISPCALETIA